MNDAHGVIHVHSCPVALAPHVESTLRHILGAESPFEWIDQPCEQGSVRTTVTWTGPSGSASRCASALRGWDHTRFEVWEATNVNRDGVRFVHTPDLGIFFTLTDAAGNAMVGEDRVRYAIEMARGDIAELENELSLALGTAWDDELEPYRRATEQQVTARQRVRAGTRST